MRGGGAARADLAAERGHVRVAAAGVVVHVGGRQRGGALVVRDGVGLVRRDAEGVGEAAAAVGPRLLGRGRARWGMCVVCVWCVCGVVGAWCVCGA